MSAEDFRALWVLGGCLSLLVSVVNYWNDAWDTRRLVRENINGEVRHAAKNERQAELFRVLSFTCLTLAAVISADGPPGLHQLEVLALLAFGLLVGGASAVRAFFNRRRAWTLARKPTWPHVDRRSPP